MSKTIQVRNVPDHVHRLLKARAADGGMSLSRYLLVELTKLSDRPSRDEVLARLARRPTVGRGPASADLVRADRNHR